MENQYNLYYIISILDLCILCEESQSHHINKNWIFNYDLLEICLNVL